MKLCRCSLWTLTLAVGRSRIPPDWNECIDEEARMAKPTKNAPAICLATGGVMAVGAIAGIVTGEPLWLWRG